MNLLTLRRSTRRRHDAADNPDRCGNLDAGRSTLDFDRLGSTSQSLEDGGRSRRRSDLEAGLT